MNIVIQWAANLLFALMVAMAYISFAFAYRRMGALAWTLDYFLSMAMSPFFIGGLALSFSSTFVRLVMFSALGVSRTVLASELSVVMMLVLSFVFFREILNTRELVGCSLILTGILLVGLK